MTSSIHENNPLLALIQTSTDALRHISNLDLAGRSMMAFMRGHMAEIQQSMSAKEYFTRFYTEVGKEFIQYDDYSFVLHHCSRFLYAHWKAEIDLLHAGPFGAALEEIGARLPVMRSKPTSPARRPGAVQGSWYQEVWLF